MFKRYFELRRISFTTISFGTLKIFAVNVYLYVLRKYVIRCFADSQIFWRSINTYFEFDLSWLDLSRFHDFLSKLWVLVLIALISKINGSYHLWLNMGTQLIHDWQIGGRLYPWRASGHIQSGYSLAGQASVGQAYSQDLKFVTFYWNVCRGVDGLRAFYFLSNEEAEEIVDPCIH